MYRLALTMLASVFMGTAMAQDYPVTPVPFTDVSVSDNFWSPRLKTSREITLPSCFKRCEEIGLIDNFAVAGGLMEGIHRGARYGDSDLYKVMQGAAYQLSLKPNPELDRYVDEVITKTDKKSPKAYAMYGKPRWARMDHGHELYCMGHMIEAAVAHYQATGRRNFLDVAIRSADLICRTFGPNEGQLHNVPGHQEAYNETCATIGTSFLNHRLFLLHKDAKYFDLFEPASCPLYQVTFTLMTKTTSISTCL